MSRRVVIGVRTSISTMVTRDLGVRSRIIHRIRVNAKWLGLAQHTPYWLILMSFLLSNQSIQLPQVRLGKRRQGLKSDTSS